MKRIALVAACDRFNYGDVLMPILFEKYYMLNGKSAVNFDYFALSSADLRGVGGKQTQPIKNIDDRYEYVIVAGGEVLTASYRGMWQNLQTKDLPVTLIRKISRVSGTFAERICRYLLKGKTVLPWTIFPKGKDQKVFYNSVGGQELDQLSGNARNEINKLIETSVRFSVRDEKTWELIKRLNSKMSVSLIPDTAITMSRLISDDELREKATQDVIDIVERQDAYYVIQVSKDFGESICKDLAIAIDKIYESTGIICVLLPIARVQGHEDDVPLRRIASLCKKGSCVFIAQNNIYDVILLISNCAAFMGTSLHGVITAASYYVPHAVINPKCLKTRNFIRTWNTSVVDSLNDVEEIFDFVTHAKTKYLVDSERIKDMQDTVLKYYNEIVDMIDDEEH